MNNKQFLNEVKTLTNLIKNSDNSLSAKFKIWKQKRVVNKMIKQVAKAQAKIVYQQTWDLYQDIIKSNLE